MHARAEMGKTVWKNVGPLKQMQGKVADLKPGAGIALNDSTLTLDMRPNTVTCYQPVLILTNAKGDFLRSPRRVMNEMQ